MENLIINILNLTPGISSLDLLLKLGKLSEYETPQVKNTVMNMIKDGKIGVIEWEIEKDNYNSLLFPADYNISTKNLKNNH